MSSVNLLPHSCNRESGRATRTYRAPAMAVDYSGGTAQVTLRGDTVGAAVCLGCYDAPCMVANQPSLPAQSPLENFPADSTTEVCPWDAIQWSASTGLAEIDRANCIGCGLCAARCPYGAITMDSDGTAVVQSDDVDRLTRLTRLTVDSPSSGTAHQPVIRKNPIGVGSPKLHDLPHVFATLPSAQVTQFVRNVLHACGVPSRMRRKGDQNVRMDGVFQLESGALGPIEVDLGTETLEPLRSLVEDVAVLHGRYGAPLSQLVPLTVLLTLPSNRSEYYRLVSDVEKITGIRLLTVTLGVLISLMWQFHKIDGFDDNIFFVDQHQKSIWEPLRSRWPALIQHQLHLGAYYPSR